MARRVFFSFHYERDVWRASVVRNSWVTHADRESAGFFDASLWEDAKSRGDAAIRQMIDSALQGTSVTAVLIGAETANRQYVQYEINSSMARGNGILGIRIHGIANRNGQADLMGANPLTYQYSVYDWVANSGYQNVGAWIEAAARQAGR